MKVDKIPLQRGRQLRATRGGGWELAEEDGRRIRYLDHFEAQYVDAALAVALQPDYEEVLAEHYRLVRELDLLLNGTRAEQRASLADIVAQLRTEREKRRAVDPLGTAGLLRALSLEASAVPRYDQAAEARIRQPAARVLAEVFARDLRDMWGRLTIEHSEQEEALRAAATARLALRDDPKFLHLAEQIRAEGHNGGTADEEIAALAAYLEK
jgi:hypothetical protein